MISTWGSLGSVLPCHVWAYVSILCDAIMLRRNGPSTDEKTRPVEVKKMKNVFRIFDFMIFFDFTTFSFGRVILLPRKQIIQRDGQVGSIASYLV